MSSSDVGVRMEPLLVPDEVSPGSLEPMKKRIASLDIFRGLTIAVMILVDDAGGLWPKINHSPWNGVTLADFVMPFFLFIVGFSIVLALKRVRDRKKAGQKILIRFSKLFALGIFLQGGYFHDVGHLDYGVDIEHIRILGILQRIAFAYLIVASCEVLFKSWLVEERAVQFWEFFTAYQYHWFVAWLISSLYLGLLYGLYMPDWKFEHFIALPSSSPLEFNSTMLTVNCNVRGDLGPACNAVGYIDRSILGLSHLYQHPVYRRTKYCSIKSPDSGSLPPDAPEWCLAPFDPEGLLSSIMAIVSCFIGVHYGHVLVHFKEHKMRLWNWLPFSFILLCLGILLHYIGMPLNKPLYSFSYTLMTAGAAGLVFCILYILVDVYRWETVLILLEWMGMNALLIYVLAASELFPTIVQGFYWRKPENNLLNAIEKGLLENLFHSQRWAKMCYVLLEIIFWCLVAGLLKRKGIYWKF